MAEANLDFSVSVPENFRKKLLDDPRLRLVEEDGRSLLFESPDRYDVVTVEVSSIWFAGVGSIYSREFYQLARS